VGGVASYCGCRLRIKASDAENLITESAKALYSFIFGEFLETSKSQSGEEYVVELDCIDLLELFRVLAE